MLLSHIEGLLRGNVSEERTATFFRAEDGSTRSKSTDDNHVHMVPIYLQLLDFDL
jgi:hypothetical protein